MLWSLYIIPRAPLSYYFLYPFLLNFLLSSNFNVVNIFLCHSYSLLSALCFFRSFILFHFLKNYAFLGWYFMSSVFTSSFKNAVNYLVFFLVYSSFNGLLICMFFFCFLSRCIRSQGSSLSKVTKLRAGLSEFNLRQNRIILFTTKSRTAVGPYNVLFRRYQFFQG